MAKYLLSALIFATNAIAQDCSGTLTITASADVSALASCTTYSGSVVIPTGLAVPKDENGHQTLELTKVQKITGNLTVNNIDTLTELHMDSIVSVTGLELTNLTQLNTLSIQQLTTLEELSWSALPALQAWSGNALTAATSILITNTGITEIENLSGIKSLEFFNVNNNQGLVNITLNVVSIKQSLDIEANDYLTSGLSTSFPFLETAQNMTFRNCSQILLPALKNVTDEIGFYENGLTSFNAPKLSTVGGIVFVGNPDLTNVTLPQLSSINGTCLVANNTEFKIIDGFPKLSIITGDVSFSGNFTEVDLPALTQVAGAFNLQTSGEFDCSGFDSANSNKKIKGKYTCKGSQATPQSGDGTSTSTSTGAAASKTGAASAFDVNLPFVMGGSSFVAALLQILL